MNTNMIVITIAANFGVRCPILSLANLLIFLLLIIMCPGEPDGKSGYLMKKRTHCEQLDPFLRAVYYSGIREIAQATGRLKPV